MLITPKATSQLITDINLAWPTAQIAVMGGAQAARVLSTVRGDMDEAARDAFEAPILETYEREGSPYYSTARLWDDGIIDPLDTRRVLSLGIEAALHAPIPDTRFGVVVPAPEPETPAAAVAPPDPGGSCVLPDPVRKIVHRGPWIRRSG